MSDQLLPKQQIFKIRFCGTTSPGSDLKGPPTGWHEAAEVGEEVLPVWILTASVAKPPPIGLA